MAVRTAARRSASRRAGTEGTHTVTVIGTYDGRHTTKTFKIK